MRFHLKSGDTSPSLRARVLDEAGAPLGLAGASASFSMRDARGMLQIDHAAAVIEDDQTLRYDWAEGDTAATGTAMAEFEITWPGGRIETVPNHGYIEIVIGKALA